MQGILSITLIHGTEKVIGGQDYKEKHKLDSKQISDSAFGAHLSFCQK